MRPVSMWIQGSFWDSQIYAGELVLFDDRGAMHRIDWAAVIDQLAVANDSIQTALRVAFSDSDLFYTQKVRKILRDPAIERIVKQQLDELAQLQMAAGPAMWAKHWRTGGTPFDFLPTDTDVYYNRLFASGDSGLYSAPRSSAGAASSSRTAKHFDGRILQIKASNQNTAVAAAAGTDGLFEFAVETSSGSILEPRHRVAPIPCSACDWAFQSIVAWNNDSAFFASFREDRDPRSKLKVRRFDQVLRQEQILEGQGLRLDGHARVWGSHEKVFCMSKGGLDVLDYIPPPTNPAKDQHTAARKAKFSKKGNLAIAFDADEVIATGTAPFGTVIEFDEKIVVLRSDGEVETFEGAAVHWRVFPRSEHYSNQLHIIYDDRIQIISFMHDYFVEQTTKLTGFARGSNDYVVRDGRDIRVRVNA